MSTEGVRVRELVSDDYSSILEVWTDAGLPIRRNGRDSREAIHQQIADTHIKFLGACFESKVIGVVLLSHDGRKGWINRLAVKPEYRGHGIAKLLIKYGEEWFKELGINVICALIEEDNNQSLALFKSKGFSKHEVCYFRKFLVDEY